MVFSLRTDIWRTQLMRQLVLNGKYHDFKVKLSRAIVKIIKDRFHQVITGNLFSVVSGQRPVSD
jgi:hypothetical protein